MYSMPIIFFIIKKIDLFTSKKNKEKKMTGNPGFPLTFYYSDKSV